MLIGAHAMAVVAEAVPQRRIRDPQRREKIVASAARLIAADGYTAVSIGEIGAAAGIVGSGIYRHFESKGAVLTAIFDEVIDDLLAGLARAVHEESNLEAALSSILEAQIEFVVGSRAIAQVYYSEVKNLPEADRRRLRRKQRLYIEGWVSLIRELRADLSDSLARVRVHAAIGVIHSSLNYDTNLSDRALRQFLANSARQVLGCGATVPSPTEVLLGSE